MSQFSGRPWFRRPRITSVVRNATGLALLATFAVTPLTSAQSTPSGAACSDQARLGLASIGAWAEAQCSSGGSMAFGPLASSTCPDAVLQGLRRVGGWAEPPCTSGDRLEGN